MKRVFLRFEQSLRDTPNLQPRYYRLTTRIGFVGLFLGMSLVVAAMYRSWVAIGLPMRGVRFEEMPVEVLAWFGVTLLSVPLALYAAMVVVCGSFAAVMLARGRFSRGEALGYALYGSYPPHWLKETPARSTAA